MLMWALRRVLSSWRRRLALKDDEKVLDGHVLYFVEAGGELALRLGCLAVLAAGGQGGGGLLL